MMNFVDKQRLPAMFPMPIRNINKIVRFKPERIKRNKQNFAISYAKCLLNPLFH